MSYLHTDMMVKELLDRIGDFENDPEPKYDEFLQTIPVHVRLQLKFALQESQRAYTMEMVK